MASFNQVNVEKGCVT